MRSDGIGSKQLETKRYLTEIQLWGIALSGLSPNNRQQTNRTTERTEMTSLLKARTDRHIFAGDMDERSDRRGAWAENLLLALAWGLILLMGWY